MWRAAREERKSRKAEGNNRAKVRVKVNPTKHILELR